MVVKGIAVDSAVLHDILDGNLSYGPFINELYERISDSLFGKSWQFKNPPSARRISVKGGAVCGVKISLYYHRWREKCNYFHPSGRKVRVLSIISSARALQCASVRRPASIGSRANTSYTRFLSQVRAASRISF